MTRARLALAAASVTVLAWILMVIGGYVRVSESGLGCPDWPACHGQAVTTTGGHHALVEQAHRWVASVLVVAVVAIAIVIFRRFRRERDLVVAAAAALGILALQVVLGGVTVLLKNVSWTVVAHYGAASVLVASLALLAVRLGYPAVSSPAHDGYTRLVTWFAGVTFGLLLVGSTVANTDSHGACGTSFPLCNGTAAPHLDHHVVIHLAHRFWAAAALVLALVVWRATVRHRSGVRPLELASRGVASLFLAQVALGIAVVAAGENQAIETAHSALASLTWGATATLLWLARRLPAPEARAAAESPPPTSHAREVVADYFTLVKPRIMLLILITAYGAMAVASNGLPDLSLTLATLFGLGLSSGGASAINHYLDRDLDARMLRTAARPIPAGRVPPEAALGFGCGLVIVSFVVLATNVNLLAAVLALLGAVTYVVVYTYWLKRRTPQNIVIGGAAGALPPLVGWAAVTGHIGLPALFMFAIIFAWTPPHFWALAILAKKDYARAGIPMLPVVRGDRETARQILLYTLLLVGVTMLPFASRTFGWVYLLAALVLGAEFLALAARLVRNTSPPAARRLFVYSLAYLALLFAAIGVDRVHL